MASWASVEIMRIACNMQGRHGFVRFVGGLGLLVLQSEQKAFHSF